MKREILQRRKFSKPKKIGVIMTNEEITIFMDSVIDVCEEMKNSRRYLMKRKVVEIPKLSLNGQDSLWTSIRLDAMTPLDTSSISESANILSDKFTSLFTDTQELKQGVLVLGIYPDRSNDTFNNLYFALALDSSCYPQN